MKKKKFILFGLIGAFISGFIYLIFKKKKSNID